MECVGFVLVEVFEDEYSDGRDHVLRREVAYV